VRDHITTVLFGLVDNVIVTPEPAGICLLAVLAVASRKR